MQNQVQSQARKLCKLSDRKSCDAALQQLDYLTCVIVFAVEPSSARETVGKCIAHVYGEGAGCYDLGDGSFCAILNRGIVTSLPENGEIPDFPYEYDIPGMPEPTDALRGMNCRFAEELRALRGGADSPEVFWGYAFFDGSEPVEDIFKRAENLMREKQHRGKAAK